MKKCRLTNGIHKAVIESVPICWNGINSEAVKEKIKTKKIRTPKALRNHIKYRSFFFYAKLQEGEKWGIQDLEKK